VFSLSLSLFLSLFFSPSMSTVIKNAQELQRAEMCNVIWRYIAYPCAA
jgi:hypothetical protein